MPLLEMNVPVRTLPAGYAAVPLSAADPQGPLRVCVVVRKEADPAAGHFLTLRHPFNARVLLGCVVDAPGHVHQWLEIWIQDIAPSAGLAGVSEDSISNQQLDRRWASFAQSVASVGRCGVVRTGWEDKHPLPLFIEASSLQPFHPTHAESGGFWELCCDDDVMWAAGLPPYTTSLSRHLHVPALGESSPFVPVGRDVDPDEAQASLAKLTESVGEAIPVNPGAGLLMVRPLGSIGFEQFVDVLGGGRWEALAEGEVPFDLGGDRSESIGAGRPTLARRFFLETQGRWGRLIEAFHLKLRLFADAVAAVEAFAREQNRPILNLSPESFRVDLGVGGGHLPRFWTATVALSGPGEAVCLHVGGEASEFYFRAGEPAMSVYRPGLVTIPTRGRGGVQIRRVVAEAGADVAFNGTLRTRERLATSRDALIRFGLTLGAGLVEFCARPDADTALAGGEFRFQTIPQVIDPRGKAALQAAEGSRFPDVTFTVIPVATVACDLYSLGVLAVRALLVDSDTHFPDRLDDFLSLVREVELEYEEEIELGERIARVFAQDERWLRSLGPDHLLDEQINPQEAMQVLPPGLWWDALAILVRLFPGEGRDSACGGPGDAPPPSPHTVYDGLLTDLAKLLLRSRSLIVPDSGANQEVREVIRSQASTQP